MRFLLILALSGCSASVATSNPACIIMCQNSGDTIANKKLKED